MRAQDNKGEDTNTHSVYLTLICFVWREMVTLKRFACNVYTDINCLVFVTFWGRGLGDLNDVQTLRQVYFSREFLEFKHLELTRTSVPMTDADCRLTK